MKTKHARIIRAGIMSMCRPYKSGGNPTDGYYTSLDFLALHEFFYEWECAKDTDLGKRAQARTPVWTRTTVTLK